MNPHSRRLNRADLKNTLKRVQIPVAGKVSDIVGTIIEANLPNTQIGASARISAKAPYPDVIAEVVGFRKDKTLLLPLTPMQGITSGSTVLRESMSDSLPVGDHLLGRVLDPFLRPLDGKPMPHIEHPRHTPLEKEAPNPMLRQRISKVMSVGVRTIDGLLTFAEGQRIGIMAQAGLGKSVLMGMMARGTTADINVIGLIGERGREVREFIDKDLGPEGLARSVVIAVTGDQSPLMRVRGAKAVTALAEYFSGQGKRVLLFLDSLTRVAMAQREIGLAIGEPPTTKGYPPSVFALLPKLLERCGPQSTGRGSISGMYTVLVDGDDFTDPIPEAARAILDGHINLSRELAAKGHFPAIDVTTSASRVMYDVVSNDHWKRAAAFRSLLGVYRDNYDFIQIGSYQKGSNPKLDQAMAMMPKLDKFLQQDIAELTSFDNTMQHLCSLIPLAPEAVG